MPEEEKSIFKGNTTIIVTILASLGLLGGGGGYMVNSGLSDLGNELSSEIAVIKNDMEHVREAQKAISEKFVDDFKDHVNNPALHAQGQQRMRQEMKVERDKLYERIREPMKKQWEILGDLKERITKLETWKEGVEE